VNDSKVGDAHAAQVPSFPASEPARTLDSELKLHLIQPGCEFVESGKSSLPDAPVPNLIQIHTTPLPSVDQHRLIEVRPRFPVDLLN
jgi:hypothetical protein